jgi:hypothetical protein
MAIAMATSLATVDADLRAPLAHARRVDWACNGEPEQGAGLAAVEPARHATR